MQTLPATIKTQAKALKRDLNIMRNTLIHLDNHPDPKCYIDVLHAEFVMLRMTYETLRDTLTIANADTV